MLLTTGCSFVWGDELEGFDKDPATHFHLTFTHILAKKMDMPYMNQGVCGSSNDRIFRDLIDYLSDPSKKKPTHMVVMWSAWQRMEIAEPMSKERETEMGLNRPDGFTQFSPERIPVLSNATRQTRHRRELLEEYFNTCYDSRTDLSHHLTKMKTIQLLADSLGIKLIQGTFHNRCWSNIIAKLRTKDLPQYNNWLLKTLKSLPETSKVGLGTKYPDLFTITNEVGDIKPYGHPGEETQKVFAQQLFDMFTDKSLF